MSTTVAAPPKAHPARQKALEQFIAKLREWNGSASGAEGLERQARITIGSRTVTLEPWERQQLRDWFASGEDAAPEARYLLAHGAALMLKSAFDIERLIRGQNEPSAAMYAFQAELMLDTAIGMALLKDMQRSIESQVKDGQFELAKGLTQFRHRLARSVGDAKMCIAESEQEQAESIANSLTDHPELEAAPSRPRLAAPVAAQGGSSGAPAPVSIAVQHAVSTPAADIATSQEIDRPAPAALAIAPDGSAVAPAKMRRRRPRPQPAATPVPTADSEPSSTSLLTTLCLVGFAIWFVFALVPGLLHEDPVILTRGDLAAELPLASVESHAPSAYVTVEAAVWDAMDPPQRDEMIGELGRAADRRGFSGLLLRNDAGVPVAHWLSSRGAAVIEHRETGNAAPQDLTVEPPVVFRSVGGSDGR